MVTKHQIQLSKKRRDAIFAMMDVIEEMLKQEDEFYESIEGVSSGITDAVNTFNEEMDNYFDENIIDSCKSVDWDYENEWRIGAKDESSKKPS